jgi:hypothetical protein
LINLLSAVVAADFISAQAPWLEQFAESSVEVCQESDEHEA